MSSTTDTSSPNLSSTTDTSSPNLSSTSSPGNSPPSLLNQLNQLKPLTVTQPIEYRPEQNNQLPIVNPAMQWTPEQQLKMMEALMAANTVSKEQKPSGFLTWFQGTFIMKKWVFWFICFLIMLIIVGVKWINDLYLRLAKFANISDYERANNERMDNRPSALNS
jgi:hypothetical protein